MAEAAAIKEEAEVAHPGVVLSAGDCEAEDRGWR